MWTPLVDVKDLFYSTYSVWEKVKHDGPRVSILGALLFLVYLNDLPQFINNESTPVLFAVDMNIIVTNCNPIDFKKKLKMFLNIVVLFILGNFPASEFYVATFRKNLSVQSS